jgi:hypothetical protein
MHTEDITQPQKQNICIGVHSAIVWQYREKIMIGGFTVSNAAGNLQVQIVWHGSGESPQ